MNYSERQAVWSLSSIYALRMLGLFMLYPVLTSQSSQIVGATGMLLGLALGIYGLTQACLQIPFGFLSDRLGRKPIIIIGLLLLALGSVIAAFSNHIGGIILGRALQGAGAIGSSVTALVADLTADERRLRAMAKVGITIAISFCLAIVLGPLVNSWFGLSGIFWLTALLAIIGIAVVLGVVPTPPKVHHHQADQPVLSQFGNVLSHHELLRLDLGIFVLHAVLAAMFVGLPVALTHLANLDAEHQWFVYLPILFFAFVVMIPCVIIAESKRRMRGVFIGSIVALLISQFLLLFLHQTVGRIAILLWLFFTGFIVLEATLPSLVSKIAPLESKGTALGVYSTAQFLGIFVGGSAGGVAFHHWGLTGVFCLSTVLIALWLAVAAFMQPVRYLSTQIKSLQQVDRQYYEQLASQLRQFRGIHEVMVDGQDEELRLKIDKAEFDQEQLQTLLDRYQLQT